MAELRVTELEMSLGRYDLLSIAHKVHIKALEKKATSARARLAAANGAIAALTSDVDQLRVTSDDYTEIVNTLQNALDIAMATAV
ncbi:hypothetical protein LPJ61_004793 [Coemansia biformis]|uniref:Uncharacterized protein n=1 Tax=Coemansia biformis TaxID=1286918 RepID=A0A9W7YAC2_9FUNG|nr:hypothetical protein LPJ61_004793 [Coemansia biformis]